MLHRIAGSTTITTVATHTDTVIMVFQGFGIEASSYNPINLSHGSVAAPLPMAGAGGCSKKRKAFDDLDSYADATGDFHVRPKLSLPRSAGLVFNGDAQFHPLPADVNQAMLAQLGHNPFTGSSTSGSTFVTPSSSSSSGFLAGHEHKPSNGSDYFSTAAPSQYPDVEPYPPTSPTSAYGILGPAPGRHNSFSDSNSMDVDYGSSASSRSVHGPQCKSIPQLCVRYNDGSGSELWATCPDCGACSKVESNAPSSNLCYSP